MPLLTLFDDFGILKQGYTVPFGNSGSFQESDIFSKRRCRPPKGGLALKVRDCFFGAWAG